MRSTPLGRGYVALVDDEDYDRVTAMGWHPVVVHHKHSAAVYAVHTYRVSATKQSMVYLRRVVMQVHPDA